MRNPVLQEFKELIEGNPRLFMYFSSMFTEIPRKAPYDRDPTGTNTIRDYKQMLRLLDHVFGRAPEWTDSAAGVGMVGVPLAAVLDYPMATPSGHAAFLDPEVNRMLKRALNEWGKFLTTPESAKVLEANQNGWFGEVGQKDIMEVANAASGTSFKFEELFVCDPSKKYHGYKSWDGWHPPSCNMG